MKATAKNAKTVVGAIDPDVLAFTVGQDPVLDLRLAEWDCYGTAAHVTMLSRMKVSPKLFSQEECAAVLRELARIRDAARAGRFRITEEDQDCHLAIERTLTERLGDLGKRVHTGRSRNDQSATAIRLFVRDQLQGTAAELLDLAQALVVFGKKIHTGRSRNDQVAVDVRLHIKDQLHSLTAELADLASALVAFGRAHDRVPMVGRTHLQPAMPSSVATWAGAYAEELLCSDVPFLATACDCADRCPLGSAASYGVPLPIDRELTARLLGFRGPVANVLAAGNSRGKVEAETCAALAQVMVTLSRLAQDLILFSMPEFGYFSLPKEFCTGSSIMPQKYNPDVCELVRSKAAQVCGLSATANAILVGMPGGYNRDLQDTKKIVMEALDTTRASLRILARLVGGLKAHPDRLRAAFAEPGVFATDRALELVAGGMPWRDAYHQVRDHLEDLRGMDPDEAIAKKRHLGAPGAIGPALAALGALVRTLRADNRAVRARIDRALRRLLPETR